jgi:hypothetical protein
MGTRSNGSGHGRGRCGARRRDGELCRNPAGHGTDHPGIGACKLHGGATPNHQAHALAVMADRADAAALAELRARGVPPMGNPLRVLQELAAEAYQWQAILRGRVAELESLTVRTKSGAEQVRAVVAAYERGLTRTAELCAVLANLRIDERLARIDQVTGQAVADAIEQILIRLGHPDPKSTPAIGAIVADELHKLIRDDAG